MRRVGQELDPVSMVRNPRRQKIYSQRRQTPRNSIPTGIYWGCTCIPHPTTSNPHKYLPGTPTKGHPRGPLRKISFPNYCTNLSCDYEIGSSSLT